LSERAARNLVLAAQAIKVAKVCCASLPRGSFMASRFCMGAAF